MMSAVLPSQSVCVRTRWPSSRNSVAHRSAVLRLPECATGRAGVISAMFMRCDKLECRMQAARTIADTPPRRLTTTSSAGTLARRLRVARERTLAFASDLTGAQHLGPQLAIVNPPLWEIAHLGWFQEYWCLRYRDGNDFAPSLIAAADALYNSALVPHSTRWTLPLLPFDAMLRFLDEVLTRVLDRLEREPENDTLRYFAELAA